MLNGFKNPIIYTKYIDDSIFGGMSFIQLSNKCSNKSDIQKEIVKAIMQKNRLYDITLLYSINNYSSISDATTPKLTKKTCFEKLLIEQDLNG